MAKRILLGLLAVVMLVTFAACESRGTNPADLSSWSGNGSIVLNGDGRCTGVENGTYYYEVRNVTTGGTFARKGETRTYDCPGATNFAPLPEPTRDYTAGQTYEFRLCSDGVNPDSPQLCVDSDGTAHAATVQSRSDLQFDSFTVPAPPPPCTTGQPDNSAEVRTLIANTPNGGTVNFEAGRCYRIESIIEIRDRNLTLNGNGATFQSQNAPTATRSIFQAFDSTLTFRNMTIDGSYANGGVHNVNIQNAHAVDLRGSNGTVENVTMKDMAGDCVYFGLTPNTTRRSSGAVRDSSCRSIGRNAVSVTAGQDIRLERNVTDDVGYIPFDMEPNSGAGWGAQRVVVDNNEIGSYFMKAYTIIGNAPVTDLSFTNNRVVGDSLRIGITNGSFDGGTGGSRPQRVTISGNTANVAAPDNAMGIEGVDTLTVTNNTVPMAGGRMARICNSTNVTFSGNSAPGGTLGGGC